MSFIRKRVGFEEDEDAFEEKFFYRTPRFRRDVETARIKIDPPPNDQIGEGTAACTGHRSIALRHGAGIYDHRHFRNQ